MFLRDGYIKVKKALGEGGPWLFDDATIIHDLNISARAMCSAAQSIRDTYVFTTALNPTAGPGIYFQEYAMPQSCEMIVSGKILIGIMYPLSFAFTQQQLQIGGYVSSVPMAAYIRRGVNLTQQVPPTTINNVTTGGEIVMPAPGMVGKTANFVVGLYPTPAGVYQCFIDHVAYHPQMNEPLDPCLLPDTSEFFDAWCAYAIANGKEAEGDLVSCQTYKKMHQDGVEAYKLYQFSAGAQVTPPTWGGSNQNPLFSHGPGVLVMAPTASQLNID